MTSEVRVPLPRTTSTSLSMTELQHALRKHMRLPELGHSLPVILDIAVHQHGKQVIVYSSLVNAESDLVETGTACRFDRTLDDPDQWPLLVDGLAADIARTLP